MFKRLLKEVSVVNLIYFIVFLVYFFGHHILSLEINYLVVFCMPLFSFFTALIVEYIVFLVECFNFKKASIYLYKTIFKSYLICDGNVFIIDNYYFLRSMKNKNFQKYINKRLGKSIYFSFGKNKIKFSNYYYLIMHVINNKYLLHLDDIYNYNYKVNILQNNAYINDCYKDDAVSQLSLFKRKIYELLKIFRNDSIKIYPSIKGEYNKIDKKLF